MSKNSLGLGLRVSASIIPLISTFPAATASAQQQEDAAFRIEEVVVTARRKEEALGDVPDSLLVFGADQVEKQRINQLGDLAVLSPNIGFQQDNSPTSYFISVRGITQTRNTDPAVSVWIDGVQYSNPSQLRSELFDVQQIEVLKGPQGSLYGRNAIGGAIVITTQPPTNEVDANFSASYGNADRIDATGAVSGPIIKDELLFRAAYSYHDDSGSIQNDSLNRPVDFDTAVTLRTRLMWTPNDRLTVDVRGEYDDLEAGTYYYSITRPLGDPFPSDNPRSNSNTFEANPESVPISVAHARVERVAARVSYDLGWAELSSVTAWDDTSERYGVPGEGAGGDGPGDLDFTAPELLGNSQSWSAESISEELRLSGATERIDWVAGLYFLDIDRFDTLPVYVDADGNGRLDDRPPLFPLGRERDITSYAAFGQVVYSATDALDITLGGRWDKEEQDQLDRDEGLERSTSFSLFQPKASIAWKFDPDHLLYLTASRGFRSGGFNLPRSPFGVIYDQEELWSYEVGYKGEFQDGRIRYNFAAFYEDIDNKQNFVFDVLNAAQTLYNIPESTVYGFETDVTYQPTANLTVSLAGGWMDSEIETFQFAELFPRQSTNEVVEGNKLPQFSHWSVAATVDYSRPMGDSGWDFIYHVDYSVRGDKRWNIFNDDVEKDVHIVNMSAGFENNNWRVTLWSENLSDTDYWSNWFNQDTTNLPDIGQFAEERRFGVRVAYRM